MSCQFIEGIQFEFSYGIDLLPRERLVSVKDLDAFHQKHGEEITVVGEFSGNLSNGGERLLLVDQSGQIIRDFSYSDDAGWPQGADGEGPSLTLKYPESLPDHSKQQNWRSSRFSVVLSHASHYPFIFFIFAHHSLGCFFCSMPRRYKLYIFVQYFA